MKLEDFSDELLAALAEKLAVEMGHRHFVTFDMFDRQQRLLEFHIRKLASQDDLETVEDRCDDIDGELSSLAYLSEDLNRRIDERIGEGFELLADLYKSRKDN